LPDLLETATRARSASLILDVPREVVKAEEVAVEVQADLADDLGELLVSWLQELLFRFEKGAMGADPVAFDEAGWPASPGPRWVSAGSIRSAGTDTAPRGQGRHVSRLLGPPRRPTARGRQG